MGSDALYAGRFPHAWGVAIYHALDRIAPASYVEDTLGTEALARGDLDDAEHYAVRMPASQRRDQLLARIAQARGQSVLAGEYFFAADDIDALQQHVNALADHDVAAAIAFEAQVRTHLIALQTHPDAVAESFWVSGNLEVQRGRRVRALVDYRQAETLAPLDVKYILAVANDALAVGDLGVAQDAFTHGTHVAPGSGDMLAGLGLVALRRGDTTKARAYLVRAQAVDPQAAMLPSLERALQ